MISHLIFKLMKKQQSILKKKKKKWNIFLWLKASVTETNTTDVYRKLFFFS